jgi:hypothetical protein
MDANPCSSNVSRMVSRNCCSTIRSAGKNSGNPLIGVTRLIDILATLRAPTRH